MCFCEFDPVKLMQVLKSYSLDKKSINRASLSPLTTAYLPSRFLPPIPPPTAQVPVLIAYAVQYSSAVQSGFPTFLHAAAEWKSLQRSTHTHTYLPFLVIFSFLVCFLLTSSVRLTRLIFYRLLHCTVFASPFHIIMFEVVTFQHVLILGHSDTILGKGVRLGDSASSLVYIPGLRGFQGCLQPPGVNRESDSHRTWSLVSLSWYTFAVLVDECVISLCLKSDNKSVFLMHSTFLRPKNQG